MDDSKIIELYFARDEAAIDETSKKYGASLRRIAYGVTSDRETACECENDTYLRAWQLIPPHDPGEHLFAFLGRIVRGVAIDCLRKEKAQKRSAEMIELTRELEECLPGGAAADDELERKELSACINRFLDALPDKKQRIFVKRYWYFDTVKEIALSMGTSVSYVKTTLHRVRKQLKNYLVKEGYTI